MIYPLSLKFAGILAALALIASHGFALLADGTARRFLRTFPRSRTWATVLLAISAAWAWWLARTIDLGEFSPMRPILIVGLPVLAVLAWLYVEEFLAVRALGILALLAADPLLEAAFLRPEVSRLLLVCLAYAWILAGLFLVGMPYILRDLIAWVLANGKRLKALALAGIVYGAILLICALTW